MKNASWADTVDSDDETPIVEEKAPRVPTGGGPENAQAPVRQDDRDRSYRNNNDRRGGGGRGDYGRGRGSGRGDGPKKGPADIPETGPFIAYIGGLNFSTDHEAVRNFFIDGGCSSIEAVRVAQDDSGRSKGYAHVQFRNREDLVLALDAHMVKFDGREIKVFVEEKRTQIGGARDRPGGGMSKNREGGRGGYGSNRGGVAGAENDEAGGDWSRGSRRENRSGSGDHTRPDRRGDRNPRPAEGQIPSDTAGSTEKEAAAVPTVRKSLMLAPRSKPVDNSGTTQVAASSIFGEAKPRDEAAIEEARRKRAEERKNAGLPEENAEDAAKGQKAEKDKKPFVQKAERSTAMTGERNERPPRPPTDRGDGGGRGRGGGEKGKGERSTIPSKPKDKPTSSAPKDEKKTKKVRTLTGVCEETNGGGR